MTKAELRKKYLNKRLSLNEAELFTFNKNLTDRFFSWLDSSRIKVIHLFLPIETKNEPDTWLIIDRLRREYDHIRISIPKVNDHGELENFYFEGLHQLTLNKWHIPEPKQGIPTPNEKIDCVLIPLLAFDKTGHRVGYGKGFYDRFLKNCRPDCLKVGISFFEPENQIDDSEETDVKMNLVITPLSIYHF